MTQHQYDKPADLHTRITEAGSCIDWTFPLFLAATIVVAVWTVAAVLGLRTAGVGDALSVRLTWAMAAMLFIVIFIFMAIASTVITFTCGHRDDAVRFSVAAHAIGLAAVAFSLWNPEVYFGPSDMYALLKATAFCAPRVQTLTTAFDGLALWAATLVIGTSCVLVRNRIEDGTGDHAQKEEALSRQMRGAQILLYVSAALLIAGVSETAALHKWPAHDARVGRVCPTARPAPWSTLNDTDYVAGVDSSATAISAAVGTVFTLVLAAAYLPLAFLLRQRAYRVIRPYGRTEAWLGVHGFALQPTQQFAKVLLVFSPLIAGGPVSYLVTLLSR